MAPHRAEQILDHMDELYRAGNKGVKPDTFTYNVVVSGHINEFFRSLYEDGCSNVILLFGVDQCMGEKWRKGLSVTCRARFVCDGKEVSRWRQGFQTKHSNSHLGDRRLGEIW